MNKKRMINQNQLKVAAVVLVLLVSLVVFDASTDYANDQITGAATAVETADKNSILVTLNEGEVGDFTIRKPGAKDKNYQVSAHFFGNEVVLVVNGETTSKLKLNDPYTLNDGSRLVVSGISQKVVEFLLTGAFPDVTVVDENTIRATLNEGEIGDLIIRKPGAKDKNYKASAHFIGSDGVIFTINDKPTAKLRQGDAYTLEDKSRLIVSAINTREEVKKAAFTLAGVFPDVTVVDENTIKATVGTEQKVFRLREKDYKIHAIFHEASGEVQFIVNNEATAKLRQGDAYTLEDKSQLIVSTINTRDEVKKAAFTLTAPVQVASEKEKKSRVERTEITVSFMELINGWNLVSVTTPMVGKSISTISNPASLGQELRCITKEPGWIYNNEEWLFIKPTHPKLPVNSYKLDVFTQEHVGFGLWLYAENENGCTLGCGLNNCLK